MPNCYMTSQYSDTIVMESVTSRKCYTMKSFTMVCLVQWANIIIHMAITNNINNGNLIQQWTVIYSKLHELILQLLYIATSCMLASSYSIGMYICSYIVTVMYTDSSYVYLVTWPYLVSLFINTELLIISIVLENMWLYTTIKSCKCLCI